VGTQGLTVHGFPSINRTRRFYQEALGEEFELVPLSPQDSTDELDAILSFGGSRWWEQRPRPSCPILFAIHGGAIINPEIAALSDHLTTADSFLINCPSDETVLRRYFGHQSPAYELIDLPVPQGTFDPLPTTEARTILGLDPNRPIIGFVARLLPQKNAHVFLRVLADVRRRRPDADVQGLIVGSYWLDYPLLNYVGETYPEYLAALSDELDVTDAVMFAPAMDDDAQLRAIYASLDVLVHPTHAIDENFGYTPVEAMACGTPVAGAAYGGLKSTVADGSTGSLAATWTTHCGIRSDYDALVDHTVRYLDDAAAGTGHSESASAHAHERFSWDRCSTQLVDAMHGAIARWQHEPVPVQTAHACDMPLEVDDEMRGLLPENKGEPWEHFRPQIEGFVSRRTPRCSDLLAIRPAAPLKIHKGSVHLDDPTWPATFHVEPHVARFLAQHPNSVATYQALNTLNETEIDRLLAWGVLTGSPR